MIPEGEFTEQERFSGWLKTFSGKQRAEYASVLASRSALRALPALSSLFVSVRYRASWRYLMLITAFRSNIISKLSLRHNIGLISAARNANIASKRAYAPKEASDLTLSTFPNARHAMISAGYAARVKAQKSDFIIDSAVKSISNSALAIHGIWPCLSLDMRALVKNVSISGMALLPLWPSGSFFKPITVLSNAAILAAAPSFEVWLDWYEPIVDGKAPWGLPRDVADSIEMRIALGDDRGEGGRDFWDRDADVVNAEIKGWVDAARAEVNRQFENLATPQDPSAAIMVATEQGQIDRAAIPPSQRLLDTPEQRNEYGSCRKDLVELVEYGPNQLGRLSPQLAAMLAAMPELLAAANTVDFWRAMNRLRRTYNSHLNATDALPGDSAYLNPEVADDLGALLDGLNVFASFDPVLRERDYRRIAPQDRSAIFEERLLGAPVIEAILASDDLATPLAQTEIETSLANAVDAEVTEHGTQAVDQSNRTNRNVFGALIDVARNGLMGAKSIASGEAGFAWKEFRGGAYKATGAAAIGLIASELIGVTTYHLIALKLISQFRNQFIAYAQHVLQNPRIVELIEFIARLFA
jgi:hypothetical protein